MTFFCVADSTDYTHSTYLHVSFAFVNNDDDDDVVADNNVEDARHNLKPSLVQHNRG